LDALTYDEMIWNPYVAHGAGQPLLTHAMFSGFLRLGILVHRYLPERVLRQFGFMQPIPRHETTIYLRIHLRIQETQITKMMIFHNEL